MDRVLDRLWIGDATDLDGGVPFRALGFAALVDLRDGVHARPREEDVFRLLNRDGDPWDVEQVERALDFIATRIRAGRVLVACAGGISRSSSMVIGYLVRCGWDAPAAYARVREARSRIAPVPAMLNSVLRAVAHAPLAVVGEACR